MNSEKYEEIRNMTLLFFLEKLVDKGQSRSLHDLSCQFGKKGFTKEMKQIAGNSQSGLRKFLSNYPYIFTIIDDQVYITQHVRKEDEDKRDYSKEAVEYFRKKLEQYGNAEVPIGSFLGHRSQANPEIRHISGHNISEFREFLLKHNDVFCLNEDYVVLRGVLDQVDENGECVKIKRVVEEPPIDPYLMQQLVSILEETIIKLTRTTTEQDREKYLDECANSSVPLDTLFNNISATCKGELWSKLMSTTNDLYTILKMNSKIFRVQSNQVSITEERIVQLKRPSATCNSPNSNASSLYNLNSLNSLNNGINSMNHVNNNNSNNSQITNNNNLNNSPPTSLSSSSSNASAPATSIRILNNNAQNGNSILTTLHQRMRSQIVKTLNENNNLNNNQNGHLNSQMNGQMNGNRINKSIPTTRSYESIVLSQISIITNSNDGEVLINHIISNQLPVVVDLEGINLNSNGQITLVQLAVYENEYFPRLTCINKGSNFNLPKIFVFDVLFNPDLLQRPLKQLLETPKVIKIFHDCRNSSACLNNQFGVKLQNVFDIQVAHSVLDQQSQIKPVYKPRFMSMNALCDKYSSVEYENLINKKSIKRNFKKDNQYWGHRPLTDEMLFYSSLDIYLILHEVFINLKEKIRPEYYPLMDQLNEEAILAKIKPDDVKMKKKLRKTEMEVCDLKNKLFNRESKLIVLSNREIRLLRYIPLTEEIKAKIDSSQKVAKKLERFSKKPNGQSKDNLLFETSLSDSDDNHNESNYSSYDSNDTSFSSKNTESIDKCLNDSKEMSVDIFTDKLKELNESTNSCCSCHCHQSTTGSLIDSSTQTSKYLNSFESTQSLNENGTMVQTDEANNNLINFETAEKKLTNGYTNGHHHKSSKDKKNVEKCDFACQTLSTGDIVISGVFIDENVFRRK